MNDKTFEIIDPNPQELLFRRIKSNNKFGLIDHEDRIVLEPIYDAIERMVRTKSIFVCRKDDLYCYINDKCTPICDASYKYLEPARENKKWYLVEMQYNEVYYELGQAYTFNYMNSYGNLLFSEKTFLINASPFIDGKAIVLPAPFNELVVINNYGSAVKSHPYEVSRAFMPLIFLEDFFNLGLKDKINIYGTKGEIVVKLEEKVTFSYLKSSFLKRLFVRVFLWFSSLFVSIGPDRFEYKFFSNFIKNILKEGPHGLHPNNYPEEQ